MPDMYEVIGLSIILQVNVSLTGTCTNEETDARMIVVAELTLVTISL